MAAPIKHTCPDIDRAIKHLKTAIDEIMDAIEDRKVVGSIRYELIQAIDYFEDLRKSNDELRNWGEDLENELHGAAQRIEELESNLTP